MATARYTSMAQTIPAYARTVGRAVHVKIHPSPRNISESRQILRVLQQYGEVIMYQHLKHNPELRAKNTALAIYKSIESAQQLLNVSPLRFELRSGSSSSSEFQSSIVERAQAQEEATMTSPPEHIGEHLDPTESKIAISEAAQDNPSSTQHTNANPSAPSTALPTRQPSRTSPPSPRHFNLHISPSYLKHHASIQRQHYYGRFDLNTKTMMGQDLEGRVPVEGMADCRLDKGEVPLRLRNRRAEENKRERKGAWREGLGEMWERGREERERKAHGRD